MFDCIFLSCTYLISCTYLTIVATTRHFRNRISLQKCHRSRSQRRKSLGFPQGKYVLLTGKAPCLPANTGDHSHRFIQETILTSQYWKLLSPANTGDRSHH